MTIQDHGDLLAELGRAAGSDAVAEATAAYAVDGAVPAAVATPEDVPGLSRVMEAAVARNAAVVPWGGGTRSGLGNPVERYDLAVDLSALNRLERHTPADLTATVQAGITVAALQCRLAEHGQFVALDPFLPDRATVGGTLAVGFSGALKWQMGNTRDVVIGMKVVHADGKVSTSGGQVVKNVSGYDMTRMHVGALGTLGIIAEVSLKLTPLPRGEATLVAAFPSSDATFRAAMEVYDGHVVPLALTAYDSDAARRTDAPSNGECNLAIRLGGSPLALERQIREFAGACDAHGPVAVEKLDGHQAARTWRSLADLGRGKPHEAVAIGRAALKPAQLRRTYRRVAEAVPTNGFELAVIVQPAHGTLTAYLFPSGPPAPPDAVAGALAGARKAVHEADGTLVFELCPAGLKPGLDVWDYSGDSLQLMRRMKERYDPKRIMNPGRFVGGI